MFQIHTKSERKQLILGEGTAMGQKTTSKNNKISHYFWSAPCVNRYQFLAWRVFEVILMQGRFYKRATIPFLFVPLLAALILTSCQTSVDVSSKNNQATGLNGFIDSILSGNFNPLVIEHEPTVNVSEPLEFLLTANNADLSTGVPAVLFEAMKDDLSDPDNPMNPQDFPAQYTAHPYTTSPGTEPEQGKIIHLPTTTLGERVIIIGVAAGQRRFAGDSVYQVFSNNGGNITGPATLGGDPIKWRSMWLDLEGPNRDETAGTFLNYRMNVTFTLPNGSTRVRPGFFAADGAAADSSASAGNIWRVTLTPEMAGTWEYDVSFRTGTNVAISLDASDGSPGNMDGSSGTFVIGNFTGSVEDDPRNRGKRLLGDGRLYYGETIATFLKSAVDSPENLLAYDNFDNTANTHNYNPHANDYVNGDQRCASLLWGPSNDKGKNLFGAIEYLASRDINEMSFLSWNTGGDGDDVHPFAAKDNSDADRRIFDVSKLDQWGRVFECMKRFGIHQHFKTQETENDQNLNGGTLQNERKLYYRELIARFGHFDPTWNMGEEITAVPGDLGDEAAQVKKYADYIKVLDPLNPVVVHTYPGQHAIYNGGSVNLLGVQSFDGPSIQIAYGDFDALYSKTVDFIKDAKAAGKKWFAAVDENGPAGTGVPDAYTIDDIGTMHFEILNKLIWPNFMAGGGGFSAYFGYDSSEDDLSADNFRSRNIFYKYMHNAARFFRNLGNFEAMAARPELTTTANALVLTDIPAVGSYQNGQRIVLFHRNGADIQLDLSQVPSTKTFTMTRYNPLVFNEANAYTSIGQTVQGGGVVTVSLPGGQAWAMILE